VAIQNTGPVPLAYTAQTNWNGTGEPPGVNFGNSDELSGVLQPGEQVSILPVYLGAVTAVVGASLPFSDPNAGKFVQDEGTIPWPAGVPGSGGATTMHVAQIDVFAACQQVSTMW
jgi:hypothetical protein